MSTDIIRDEDLETVISAHLPVLLSDNNAGRRGYGNKKKKT
jgi:hypothetical protein